MSKRKKEEIDVYVEKVSAKETEGEYDTRDLCAQFSDKELMKKCQAARKFEIHQLRFNGKNTGYGRCTDQRCRDSMWLKDFLKRIFKAHFKSAFSADFFN